MKERLFSERIRMLREMRGLTQADVAAMIEISQSQYSKLEAAPINFRLSQIEKVSKALGLTLAELLDDGKRWENMIQIINTLSKRWQDYAESLKEENEFERSMLQREKRELKNLEKRVQLEQQSEYAERKHLLKELYEIKDRNAHLESSLFQSSKKFNELKKASRTAVDFLEEIESYLTLDRIRILFHDYQPNTDLDINALARVLDDLKKEIKKVKVDAYKKIRNLEFPELK